MIEAVPDMTITHPVHVPNGSRSPSNPWALLVDWQWVSHIYKNKAMLLTRLRREEVPIHILQM